MSRTFAYHFDAELLTRDPGGLHQRHAQWRDFIFARQKAAGVTRPPTVDTPLVRTGPFLVSTLEWN